MVFKHKNLARRLLLAPIIGLIISCSNEKVSTNSELGVDTVFTNGRIYTQNAAQPWAQAVAVRDGKIVYIGDAAGVESYIARASNIIDLDGKLAMPGLNDAHLHPVMGGLKTLFECSFAFSATPADVAEAISSCVAANPDADWIIGGQWDSNFFTSHDIKSPRAFLDKVSGGKAVYLIADSGHDAWVNSRVLALAKIDENTPAVDGGTIVIDSKTGKPNGILLENAKQLAEAVKPSWSADQYRAAVQSSMQMANRFGITGFKEAWASAEALTAYKELADDGLVTLHIGTSIDLKYAKTEAGGFDLTKLEELRDLNRATNVDTRFVKIFMDGVPTSSRTAAMLDNYLSDNSSSEVHSGHAHYSEPDLTEILRQLDQAGFTVKIHTAGDRSVRTTLNAIARVREINGQSGLRHELAHAGYIHPDDIPRFVSLGAVADLSPYLWHPSPIIDSIISAVGPRALDYFPIKSLLENRAPVLAGSDWPAAVPSMNPWVGIEAMVSRMDPRGTSPGKLWHRQAITVEQALSIYTHSGAAALRIGDISGSIELGKMADIIVLDQNVFEVPVADISDTEIELTMFEGKLVYQK